MNRIDDVTTEIFGPRECIRFLKDHELSVGRLVLVEHPEPEPVPAAYAVVDGSLVFRTGPGTAFEVGNAEQHVFFEVEGHDDRGEPDWTVTVRGRCEAITPNHRLYQLGAASLSPHSNRGNDVWVMIHPDAVVGRR